MHTEAPADRVFYRSPRKSYPTAVRAEGVFIYDQTGKSYLDGSGGAVVPREGYFQRIREICDRYDVLLIVDEVMTGVGRTGKNFAVDHWAVVPDMRVGSKGLASGYTPIYCVVTKEAVHTAIRDGNGVFVHGHTYGRSTRGSSSIPVAEEPTGCAGTTSCSPRLSSSARSRSINWWGSSMKPSPRFPRREIFDRVLKNKYQAVSYGVRRFGKRSPSGSYVSIYKSRTTPDHGRRRRFSTPW